MKVSIVGIGKTGSTIAYVLIDSGIFSEVYLMDKKPDIARGEALDLNHAFCGSPTKITHGPLSGTSHSDYVIITAGVPRKEGITREGLFDINFPIVKEIVDCAAKLSPGCTFLIVTNPVDRITKELDMGCFCKPVGNVFI